MSRNPRIDNRRSLHIISLKFIELLSNRPELEVAREDTKVEASSEDLEYLMSIIPFAIGTEFIDEKWIQNLFEKLNNQFCLDMKSYKGTVQMYL